MFFQMTQVMDIMEDFLRFKDFNFLRLDGSTKADDRTAMLTTFNGDKDIFVFLLSTRAGGLGLNLQSADTVIIFDSDWNPHQDLQAQDRAHRIGQTKEVRVIRLVTSNSVEETILSRANYKLDMDGKIIQAGRFDNKSTNAEREAMLRALLEATPEDAEKQSDINDDDELNEIIARNDAELELYKRIDEEREEAEQEAWQAKGKDGSKPPRLISTEELPENYRTDDISRYIEVEDLNKQRTARRDGEVRYDGRPS